MLDSAAPDPAPGPALAITGLRIAFPGIGTVLDIPELALPGGSVVAIEGPSGAGKTSLLHALAGLEQPGAGTIDWGGTAIWSLDRRARDAWRRRALGLVFQDIHLIDGLSAEENVTLPVLFERVAVPRPMRARARDLLDGLGVDAARPIGVMSRGERQRVALARALLPRPALLLADEPTASLDRHAAADVARLLIDAATTARATLVVTSHDEALLTQIPTRLKLEAGHLLPLANSPAPTPTPLPSPSPAGGRGPG